MDLFLSLSLFPFTLYQLRSIRRDKNLYSSLALPLDLAHKNITRATITVARRRACTSCSAERHKARSLPVSGTRREKNGHDPAAIRASNSLSIMRQRLA